MTDFYYLIESYETEGEDFFRLRATPVDADGQPLDTYAPLNFCYPSEEERVKGIARLERVAERIDG